MKNLFVLLAAAVLISCQDVKKQPGNEYQPFFHFDKIEYYHTPMTLKELQMIELKADKTRKEQALLQILSGNIPVSIKDTLFIKNMDILGFKKDTLAPSLNAKIAALFSLREVDKIVPPACSKGYKDVLIFRKNNKIIGMAKISFDCQNHQMIGERYNDSEFGQSGEYQKLKAILNPYQ